jgi:hypothetical protein
VLVVNPVLQDGVGMKNDMLSFTAVDNECTASPCLILNSRPPVHGPEEVPVNVGVADAQASISC